MVLGECKALTHLDLSWNDIRDEKAGRLTGVLGECKVEAMGADVGVTLTLKATLTVTVTNSMTVTHGQ